MGLIRKSVAQVFIRLGALASALGSCLLGYKEGGVIKPTLSVKVESPIDYGTVAELMRHAASNEIFKARKKRGFVAELPRKNDTTL